MKKTIYLLAATMFVGATIFTSCSSSSNKVENAEDNVTEAKKDLNEAEMDYKTAIQDFKNETNNRIAENDKRIAEMKAKTDNDGKNVRKDRNDNDRNDNDRIIELERKNNDMKVRMDAYEDNGPDGWESFKREFNHDMDELGNAINGITVNNKK